MTDLERAILHIKTRADAWAVKEIEKALSQEPTEKPMCDRNICLNNEYNGIGCDECVVNKVEQEPCEDAISREDAIQAVNNTLAEYIPYFRNDQIGIPLKCARALNDLSSVTQKSGKWIAYEVQLPDRTILNYRCSVCGRKLIGYSTETLSEAPFCHCGARMESEDKE